tara:strand:+ start:848 stop:1063 length:216 start_codon:yes stop_codon:yes gene_type:complete
MANMSYCRFENTLADLRDCEEALGNINDEVTEMSSYEKDALIELIELCKTITDNWDMEEVQDIINESEDKD